MEFTGNGCPVAGEPSLGKRVDPEAPVRESRFVVLVSDLDVDQKPKLLQGIS
jgi:hypothetical protein